MISCIQYRGFAEFRIPIYEFRKLTSEEVPWLDNVLTTSYCSLALKCVAMEISSPKIQNGGNYDVIGDFGEKLARFCSELLMTSQCPPF